MYFSLLVQLIFCVP